MTNWTVTQRFVSVTGPDNCWVREQRQRLTGLVFPDLPMVVTRSNGTIRLDGSFFQVNYAGTFSGGDVTAVGVGQLGEAAGHARTERRSPRWRACPISPEVFPPTISAPR